MDGLAAFRVARDTANTPPDKITSQRRKPTMKTVRYISSICASLSICSRLNLCRLFRFACPGLFTRIL